MAIYVARVEEARRAHFETTQGRTQILSHAGASGNTALAINSLLRVLAGSEPNVRHYIQRNPRPDDAPVFLDDSYYVLCTLGRGGFGKVYLALELVARRLIAIKMADQKHVETAQDFLFQECQTLSEIKHPNVIRLFNTGPLPAPYMVMEYFPNGTLQDFLQTLPQAPARNDRVFAVLKSIAEGIRAIHHMGLVHADIKPANVLMGTAGDAVVADLGVTRKHQSQREFIVSSYPYTAPEILANAGVIQTSGDIFALGVVAFELYAGYPPFQMALRGNTMASDQIISHLRAGAPLTDPIFGQIPVNIGTLICRCLDSNPTARPDIDDFLIELNSDPGISKFAITQAEEKNANWDQEQRNSNDAAEVQLVTTPPLKLTTENLPPLVIGEHYETTLEVRGGRPPFSWRVQGLPEGLTHEHKTDTEAAKISGLIEKISSRAAHEIHIEVIDGKDRRIACPWPLMLCTIDPLEYITRTDGAYNVGYPASAAADAALQSTPARQPLSPAQARQMFPKYEKRFAGLYASRQPTSCPTPGPTHR
ncbi:MAG: serine/threonine-protein kinase, partial [Pseudomonadota bacterium]